tara:strand:+ start:51 stop:584 length:534 start_codon:yes stop_codon:yes gene_type:complete
MKSKKRNKKKFIKKTTKKKVNKKIKRSKFNKKYNKKTIKYKRLKGVRKQSSAMYNEYLEIARPRMGGSAAETNMGANVTNMEISTNDLRRLQRGEQFAREVEVQHLNNVTELRHRQDIVLDMISRGQITTTQGQDQFNEITVSVQREMDAAREAEILVNFYRAEVEAAEAARQMGFR